MLKYVDTAVSLAEIPTETSLCINISNCPIHCRGCHSKRLWRNIGHPLDENAVERLIRANLGTSCVCFMGGDAAPNEIDVLAHCVRTNYPELKIAWYSGCGGFSLWQDIRNYDYVKFGPYKKKFGPLSSPTTNQRLYKITGGYLTDITYLFWHKEQ